MSTLSEIPAPSRAASRTVPAAGPIAIGSDAHKALFCSLLLDTFDPYKPAVIAWPDLSDDARARLAGLPFWDVAIETENDAALRMQCLADATADPLIREAIALNAFEERRHREVLGHMIRHYGIALGPERAPVPPKDPLWAFLRTGYGEVFDSFFAFGLFALGKRAAFLPPELVEVFEPVIQEEARHNIFFVNWVAYTRRGKPLPVRPAFTARCLAALAVQAWKRLRLAGDTGGADDGSNFTRAGREAIGVDLSPRGFLALCIAEQDRRMARYDARLLRPTLMPRLARTALRFMPGGASASPG